MDFQQLSLSDIKSDNLSGVKEEFYLNANGEPLPWEVEKYYKSLEKVRNQ